MLDADTSLFSSYPVFSIDLPKHARTERSCGDGRF